MMKNSRKSKVENRESRVERQNGLFRSSAFCARLTVVSMAACCVASAAPPADAPEAVAAFKRQHRAVGVHVDNGLVTSIHGKAFSSGATAEASVEAFLQQHVGLFGVKREELLELRTDVLMGGKLKAHHFEQRWRGIPVDATRVTLVVRGGPDHPLVMVTAKTTAVPDDLAQATLTAVQARDIAKKAVPAMVSFEQAMLVVYPRSTPPVLTWFFWAESAAGPGFERWGFYVDAVNGKILEQRDGIMHADIAGSVVGMATPGFFPDQENNPTEELGIFGTHVFVSGGGETYVQPDGSFVLPNEGNQDVTVRMDLNGQWCAVDNTIPVIPTLTAEMDVSPPGPADFVLNETPTEFVTAQLNAMIHTTIIHDFVKGIIPEFNGIDLAIPTRVNLADDCNAFYTLGNPSINFFTSQAGQQPHCPNTANSTVIYHEYGHFIIDRALGGAAAGDYHEGVADAIAALLVDDPCVGPDFFGEDTGCLRHADEPDFIAPVGHPDTHCSGLAIAGAYWDLRTELIDRLGIDEGMALALRLMYNQILAGPGLLCTGNNNCGGITVTVLTLDDDDDDIFNGTPNFVAIQRAFSRHGMPGPELSVLEFSHPNGIPRTSSPLGSGSVPLQILDGDVGTLDESAVTLHYSDDGEDFAEMPLTPADVTPDGADFDVPLPAADCFATLYWFVSARTAAGDLITDPPDGAAAPYTALVVTALESVLEDSFEDDLGWVTQAVPYDDPFDPGEQDLTTGGWERAVPDAVVSNSSGDGTCSPTVELEFSQPGGGYPEADGAFTFVTGGAGGASPGALDVDWGPVQLVSPVLESPGGLAQFSYARWFFNDDGDDSLTVEISNDGGQSWTMVETVTGQTDWHKVEFAVADFLGQTDQMVFRFSTADEPNNSITEACIDEFALAAMFCATADADHDNDIDLSDFGGLQRCFTGADAGSLDAGCEAFDFDLDDDVDLTDYGQFVTALNGDRGK